MKIYLHETNERFVLLGVVFIDLKVVELVICLKYIDVCRNVKRHDLLLRGNSLVLMKSYFNEKLKL